jgi:hypothetical protein
LIALLLEVMISCSTAWSYDYRGCGPSQSSLPKHQI